jgi:hypothetical protein
MTEFWRLANNYAYYQFLRVALNGANSANETPTAQNKRQKVQTSQEGLCNPVVAVDAVGAF